MKIALVLYVARYLADHPEADARASARRWRRSRIVAGPACLLIVVEPDLGTALVVAFTLTMLLIAAGMPLRYLGILAAIGGGRRPAAGARPALPAARLTSFLNPWASKSTAGFQAVQGQIALGSGGLLGVGLGKSVQKIFYLPEAQTDFILAVIGEELGVLGICGVVFLYGMIAYAGLRTARRAAGRYAKLLATGLTSLILCQGILNIFVVLGLAPLTGVPLPFISYAPTNLCVMLASVRPARRHAEGVRGQPCVRAAASARRTAGQACVGTGVRRRVSRRPREAPLIVIGAGGTAGHVVPALAVADALRAEGAEVVFVGGERAERELVPAAGYELRTAAGRAAGRAAARPAALRAAAVDAGAVRRRPAADARAAAGGGARRRRLRGRSGGPGGGDSPGCRWC